MNKINYMLCYCLLLCLFTINCEGKSKVFKIENNHSNETFQHHIQLQLQDLNGVPVPYSQFWVALNILKEGSRVTIQLPLINFQTGPYAHAPYEPINGSTTGGYITTSDGFLPKKIRPTDIIHHSILGASNKGLSLPFSSSASTYPVPPSGYILSVTNGGALTIQQAGSSGNLILKGSQVLLPTDISYLLQPTITLKSNKLISTGPTNTTQFTDGPANDGFRDTHVNDAYDGVAAWSWVDNSMIADKTTNTVNAMVAIGRLNNKGKLKVNPPVQLTDLPPGIIAWDTAVAINRTNPDNIVVSYGVINYNIDTPALMYRAVSFDGGKTWPENGPVNVQPAGGFGDYRGVASDKYGNMWLCATVTNQHDAPYFVVSVDGGVTFEEVYTLPDHPKHTSYDIPQYCFGGDGFGNYGLHFTTDDYLRDNNVAPVQGFIPIKGLGSFGTPETPILLTSFLNVLYYSSMTASKEGKVWLFGMSANPYTNITPYSTVYKTPGPLDQNYAGLWDYGYQNNINNLDNNVGFPYISQPVEGYFNSAQSNYYDDKRKALYQVMAAPSPDFSPGMRISFGVSRNNGQTWSNAINIANSNFGNRGFQSMALDTARGDLYFGWYDGRNDPTFKSVEYYGAVIPAKALNKLVKKIPSSNPRYGTGKAGIPITKVR